MGAVVAVEVAPPPKAVHELAALLEACSAALPEGECQTPAEITAADSTIATAWVSWLDSATVHIDVKLSTSESRTSTREFTFAEEDLPAQRFRTVGLTIATIVDELHLRTRSAEVTNVPAAASPRAQPGEPPAEAVATRPAPAPSTRRAEPATPEELPPKSIREQQNAVEVDSFLGTGLASGPLRVGLVGRALHDVSALPLFADIEVGYSLLVSSREPKVSWNEFALGGGMRAHLRGVRGEFGVRALLERTTASASDPLSGVDDSKDTWLPGFRLAGTVAWPSEGPVKLTLGARASFLLREIRITNAGVAQARVPSHTVGVLGGVRLTF
jgi:hypothetical protein